MLLGEPPSLGRQVAEHLVDRLVEARVARGPNQREKRRPAENGRTVGRWLVWTMTLWGQQGNRLVTAINVESDDLGTGERVYDCDRGGGGTGTGDIGVKAG